MNVRQPGKNTIQQQPPQQQPQPNYNPRNNAPQQFNLHPYDQDGPQKFSYGSPYVSGAGAGQPPRMPLVTGIPGPNQSLPGTPNASVGGMPQGPPPNAYVSHGQLDLSKQTPPHHQGQHHPLPPGSLSVNQQIMANAGHAGPMQGRPAQGNNQYFQRNPNIRPGNQPMRPPMHGGGASMNASHPPNAQAMPYSHTQSAMINQPVLFVLGDQYNNQTQMYPAYPNAANYYQQGNMVPPGSVQFQPQPRAATAAPYVYRQSASPYQFPMQTTQTVYYPQQPQQPQQQVQQQQQAQQVQQQQPQQQAQQQPQQQVIVTPAVTTPQSTPSQQRESGSSSAGRKARSSALRIIDPDTHTDVLTGEKVAPSDVATPTTTQPPDLPSTPGSTPASSVAIPVTVQVPATSSATLAAVITSVSAASPAVPAATSTGTITSAKVTPATVDAPKKEELAAPVTPSASAIVVEPLSTTGPVAALTSQEAKKTTDPKAKTVESTPLATGKTESVVAQPVPIASVATLPAPTATLVAPVPAAVSAQENGVAAVASATSVTATTTSELSATTSPTPVSTSTSPEAAEGRGTQKGGSKKRKSSNSRTGSSTPTTPPPPLVQAPAAPVSALAMASPVVEQPAVIVAPPTQSKPEAESSDSSVPAVQMEAVNVKETTPQPEVVVAAPTSVVVVDKKPMVADKPATVEVPVQSVITNGDQTSSPSSSVIESSVTTPTAVTAEEGSGGKSSSLRYSYKDDQWSPVNPEGKKTYDRNFLLELMNNPASQKKPDGLPNLEVVRDKQSALTGVRRGVSVGDFTPGFMKPMPVKGMVKRPSQQGQRGDQGGGMGGQMQRDGPPQRREIKLPSSSLVRVERVEDPNVWKPKHAAVKAKEEDPDKSSIEEMSKAVRGILNKLTPSKFDKLLSRIQALNIDTEERLAEVIRLFFEKAVDEPIFSPTYAKMCHVLSTKEVASSNNPSETTNFRKLLLTRCQKEFEKDSAGLIEVENKRKEIEENEAEDKKKILEEELEDLINKNRRRSLGNIRFIGELFKLRILSAKIMHQCILRLLSQPEDEESLECLCRLLSTIGKELESPAVQTSTARSASSSSRETMNSYFSTLDSIVQKRKVSNRIRFMIQDVVDLRKCQWKPRREDNKPQTIEQVHQDALREREQQERELNNPQFQGSMGGGGGGQMRDNRGGGDRRGDRGDDRNRKQSRPNDDGWNTVSNNSRSNAKLDMSKLRIPKAASGDADQGISLGPGGRGMGAWGRGASGGMQSQSMIGGTSTGGGSGQDSRANRYHLLEDEHGSPHMPSEASKAPFSGRSSLGGPPAQGNRGGNQDYRNMPGSTKSAFFPPKDAGERPERASFDSARQPSFGPGGRSRSQQSSRENSVTRPVRDAAQPPPLLREPSKEMLLGKATSSDDEIERKANSLLGEFFINEHIEDTVLDMKEWLHPATVSKFINQCLMHVLELKRKERRGTGTLLKEMIKRQLFTSKDILDGFAEVLLSAEDFLVDIPKLWEYLAEMVEPLFEDGAMTFGFLGLLSTSLGSSLAPHFVAAVLKELVIAQGTAGAERIWGMSNTTLAIVLPEIDVKAFVSQHKGLDFVQNVDSTSRIAVSGGKSNCGNASAPTSVYIDFQHKLEKYLRGSQLSVEEVCLWIKDQRMAEDNPAFIRALTTAITESAIDGYGTDSKLNGETLKKWTEVLRRYVENIADRELQLLFAVQTLVTQRQHPKGLIQGIFETLYDCNVVSEEGFTSWTTSDDPSEREGKAVALKSITSFLTWLNEAEAESDQEVDG